MVKHSPSIMSGVFSVIKAEKDLQYLKKVFDWIRRSTTTSWRKREFLSWIFRELSSSNKTMRHAIHQEKQKSGLKKIGLRFWTGPAIVQTSLPLKIFGEAWRWKSMLKDIPTYKILFKTSNRHGSKFLWMNVNDLWNQCHEGSKVFYRAMVTQRNTDFYYLLR